MRSDEPWRPIHSKKTPTQLTPKSFESEEGVSRRSYVTSPWMSSVIGRLCLPALFPMDLEGRGSTTARLLSPPVNLTTHAATAVRPLCKHYWSGLYLMF